MCASSVAPKTCNQLYMSPSYQRAGMRQVLKTLSSSFSSSILPPSFLLSEPCLFAFSKNVWMRWGVSSVYPHEDSVRKKTRPHWHSAIIPPRPPHDRKYCPPRPPQHPQRGYPM